MAIFRSTTIEPDFQIIVRSDLRARAEQDHRRADQADDGADQVPAVRPGPFHQPEPDQRGGDVDAAVGGEGAPGEIALDTGQREGEDRPARAPGSILGSIGS